MTNLLISVIIPAYNEEKYIGACLQSVVNQDFPKEKYEIIVVNNNSTDKTKEIVQKNFPKVKIIDELKKGVVFARITGINQAKGEIIVFTDADAIAPKNWLSNYYKEFSDPKVVGAGGYIHFQPSTLFTIFKEHTSNFSLSLFKLFTGNNMAFRKEAYERVGGFSPLVNQAEDAYIATKLKEVGKLKIIKKNKVVASSRRSVYFYDVPHEIRYWMSFLSFKFLKKPVFYDFKAVRDRGFLEEHE